jgi:GNAT superfamily N-acetyltransferase
VTPILGRRSGTIERMALIGAALRYVQRAGLVGRWGGARTMSVAVRHAVPADIEAVLVLMRELAEHEGLSGYFRLTKETLARYCFDAPARLEILVAVGEAGVIGYATYMAQLSPWAGREYLFVDDVYVAASQRGRGVGGLLMQRIGEVATEREMDVRWHVETENTSAQKFYEALGAELRSRFIAYWSQESIRSARARGSAPAQTAGDRPR